MPSSRRPALWVVLLLLIILSTGYYLQTATNVINITNLTPPAPPPAPPPQENNNEKENGDGNINEENANGDTNGNENGSKNEDAPSYTRTLVVAKLKEENTVWIDDLLENDASLTRAVYTVDDPAAELTVPANKGHEVMVYLTYIIDHYSTLSNVSIFMHAHQFTWHNNDFLNSDSALTVRRLRSEHVLRNGYVNLRCHHEPGCPDHIHPTTTTAPEDDLASIPEAAVIGHAWGELFPGLPLPRVLSQPCCAQFAVSADRIRTVPREVYRAHRDWLLHTPLEDALSGRVWEYVWQFLFTGEWEVCPPQVPCYCEAYGVCLEEGEWERYFDLQREARMLERAVEEWVEEGKKTGLEDGRIGVARAEIQEKYRVMEEIKVKAGA
jgi:hypothetical protein